MMTLIFSYMVKKIHSCNWTFLKFYWNTFLQYLNIGIVWSCNQINKSDKIGLMFKISLDRAMKLINFGKHSEAKSFCVFFYFTSKCMPHSSFHNLMMCCILLSTFQNIFNISNIIIQCQFKCFLIHSESIFPVFKPMLSLCMRHAIFTMKIFVFFDIQCNKFYDFNTFFCIFTVLKSRHFIYSLYQCVVFTFKSRCAIFWLCKCSTPSRICLINADASSSLKWSFSDI